MYECYLLTLIQSGLHLGLDADFEVFERHDDAECKRGGKTIKLYFIFNIERFLDTKSYLVDGEQKERVKTTYRTDVIRLKGHRTRLIRFKGTCHLFFCREGIRVVGRKKRVKQNRFG